MNQDTASMAALIKRMHDRETDPGGALNIIAWMQEVDAIAAKGLTTNETLSPTLPDDLNARMVALVKLVAAGNASPDIMLEARALVAEMEPVDPVEAAADDVVSSLLKRGYLFANPKQALEVARAGVEAGRALERGEG